MCLCHYHTIDCCSFVVVLKLEARLFQLCSFNTVLAILGTLCVHESFGLISISFCKEGRWDFSRDFVDSLDCFGEGVLPLQEQHVFPYVNMRRLLSMNTRFLSNRTTFLTAVVLKYFDFRTSYTFHH